MIENHKNICPSCIQGRKTCIYLIGENNRLVYVRMDSGNHLKNGREKESDLVKVHVSGIKFNIGSN
jgi:hypothetical protein